MTHSFKSAAKLTRNLTIIGFTFCAASVASAECVAPQAPSLPDGASATMENMIAGQTAVKAFQAANLEYMNCLDPLIAAATEKAKGEDATAEAIAEAKSLGEQYNAAVSAEEDLAGQFNTEIREYKAANPSN